MIDFFNKSDYQVIMSLGKKLNRSNLKTPHENIKIYETVDQKDILRHTELFITHGGMNSVSEAISFGVPMLLFPQEGDQFLNAARLDQLGLGIAQYELPSPDEMDLCLTKLRGKPYHDALHEMQISFETARNNYDIDSILVQASKNNY